MINTANLDTDIRFGEFGANKSIFHSAQNLAFLFQAKMLAELGVVLATKGVI
jgi:hypothetical protein